MSNYIVIFNIDEAEKLESIFGKTITEKIKKEIDGDGKIASILMLLNYLKMQRNIT